MNVLTGKIYYGVDLFCGGGGSGSGIINAFKDQGKEFKGLFVNHWDQAINIHSHNHPVHLHCISGVDAIDPAEDIVDDLDPEKVLDATAPLSFLWGSPECTHHSVARGGKPMNEQSRATAWCLVRWIRHRRPEVVIVENVKEFLDWGPLMQKRCKKTGRPVWVMKVRVKSKMKNVETTDIPMTQPKFMDRREYLKAMSALGYEMSLVANPKKKGLKFRAWKRELQRMGYLVDYRVLCSADYGDPTSRRRLYVQCQRIDTGNRIVWPNPTHAKPDKQGMIPVGLQPWKTARDHVIDWSNLGQSIFTRKKPLSKKTLRRIAIGLEKYGLKNFMMPQQRGGAQVKSVEDPISPVTTKSGEGVVQPNLTPFILPQNGDGDRTLSVDQPASAVTTTSRGVGVVTGGLTPCLIQQQGQSDARSVDAPLGAVLGGPKHYVLNPAMVKLKGTATAGNIDLPLDTVQAQGLHHAIMQAFLVATDQTGGNWDGGYTINGPVKTIVTKANQALVTTSIKPAVIQTAHGADHRDEARRVKDGEQPIGAIHASGGSYGVMQGELKPFMVPQFGEAPGQEPRTHSVDDPSPAVTSHGAGSVVQPVLEPFMVGTAHAGGDDSRVRGILEPLATACGNRGDTAVIRPWLYTFYSEGSVGQSIDAPAPTATTHDRMGVCYPVVEFNGEFYILDIYFRMLGVRELARAQGFSDDYEFPGTKTDAVKAIGNSVSCGVARALTLAATTQNPNINEYLLAA